MMEQTEQQLVRLAEAYATHRNLSLWRVSFLARGNGMFFKNLKDGGTCRLTTARDVLKWFDENWPSDLAWPEDIPRPSAKSEDAA